MGSIAATKNFTANADGTTTVTVSNFNFQDNWCGDNKGSNHGKKLVIKLPIRPRPETAGGLDIPTNTANSGLYVDNEIVGSFPVPELDLPKVLTIRKYGLQNNESAIFDISRVEGSDALTQMFSIILSGVKGKEFVEKTVGGLDPHFEYNVTETDWSWSYTPPINRHIAIYNM